MVASTHSTIVLELQTCVTTRLLANSDFMALATGIFDDVPELQKYPYVSYSSHTEVPWLAFGQNGADVLFLMDIWSELAGDDECYQLLGIMNTELSNNRDNPLVLENFHLVQFAYDWSTIQQESDTKTLQKLRHMPVRYHALAHV